MDSLEARDVLPLTDVEIQTLYQEAIQKFPNLAPEPVAVSSSWTWRAADGVLYLLVARLLMVDAGTTLAVAFLIAACIVFMTFAGAKCVGLFSLFGPAIAEVDKLKKIDTNDRGVLGAVVRLLAHEPESHFSNVSGKIRVNRNLIATSLESLGKLIDELVVEGASGEDTLSILRKSRLDQAERSRAKLTELDEHLASQLKDAEFAIAPIREMKRHFNKMLQISDDLSKIQAAHGLIDDTENNLIENRQEIQLLRIASMQALGSLKSIEVDIKSKELAEDEVLQLRN